jgi:hypothetical protein
MVRILGVDPGKKTGLVMVQDGEVDWFREVVFADMPAALEETVGEANIVAIEKFTISPRTLAGSRQYEALWVTGMVIYAIDRIDPEIKFTLQTPADAKSAFSDDYLREIEMYDAVKGGHARDALRQALLAQRRVLRIG